MRKDSVLKIIKTSGKQGITIDEIIEKYKELHLKDVQKPDVEEIIKQLFTENKLNLHDYIYFTYNKPTTLVFKTNKTELIKVLKNNVGKLLTIKFKKEDNTDRVCNGQFTNHLTDLGYYYFKEKGQNIKQFDAKNLLEVRVNNVIYVKK